jgi:hypothetical protein
LPRAPFLGRRGRDWTSAAQAGGPEHAQWVFDYDDAAEYDDESGYRFGAHAFAPGEYVSIRDDAGELHTFRVLSVSNAT